METWLLITYIKMKLKGLDFDTWCKNHPEDHDSKWCRELYPYNILVQVEFSESLLNVEQKFELNDIEYYVTTTKFEFQLNGRYRTTFNFSTHPLTKNKSWKNRTWNTTFQIIYTTDGQFITVFTKKEDPSKDLVVRFMKGDFEKISAQKSIPISELLFRTLTLHISEENFPNGDHNKIFPFIKNGVRELNQIAEFKRNQLDFAPIYSVGRDLWVCYAFSEEKANRIAFFNANQCKKIIVVFCIPTFTRHQRCTYPNTYILSIYEYSNFISSKLKFKYEPQITFLQNHLNTPKQYSIEELKLEISNPQKKVYEIEKTELLEALGIIKIIPKEEVDIFYSLAAINLINAWAGRMKVHEKSTIKEQKLFKNMYYFKTYLAKIIEELIAINSSYAKVYLNGDLAMIEIFNFQFSFHHVPKSVFLKSFQNSNLNSEIIWSGKKLQPIAPLIFKLAKTMRKK